MVTPIIQERTEFISVSLQEITHEIRFEPSYNSLIPAIVANLFQVMLRFENYESSSIKQKIFQEFEKLKNDFLNLKPNYKELTDYFFQVIYYIHDNSKVNFQVRYNSIFKYFKQQDFAKCCISVMECFLNDKLSEQTFNMLRNGSINLENAYLVFDLISRLFDVNIIILHETEQIVQKNTSSLKPKLYFYSKNDGYTSILYTKEMIEIENQPLLINHYSSKLLSQNNYVSALPSNTNNYSQSSTNTGPPIYNSTFPQVNYNNSPYDEKKLPPPPPAINNEEYYRPGPAYNTFESNSYNSIAFTNEPKTSNQNYYPGPATPGFNYNSITSDPISPSSNLSSSQYTIPSSSAPPLFSLTPVALQPIHSNNSHFNTSVSPPHIFSSQTNLPSASAPLINIPRALNPNTPCIPSPPPPPPPPPHPPSPMHQPTSPIVVLNSMGSWPQLNNFQDVPNVPPPLNLLSKGPQPQTFSYAPPPSPPPQLIPQAPPPPPPGHPPQLKPLAPPTPPPPPPPHPHPMPPRQDPVPKPTPVLAQYPVPAPNRMPSPDYQPAHYPPLASTGVQNKPIVMPPAQSVPAEIVKYLQSIGQVLKQYGVYDEDLRVQTDQVFKMFPEIGIAFRDTVLSIPKVNRPLPKLPVEAPLPEKNKDYRGFERPPALPDPGMIPPQIPKNEFKPPPPPPPSFPLGQSQNRNPIMERGGFARPNEGNLRNPSPTIPEYNSQQRYGDNQIFHPPGNQNYNYYMNQNKIMCIGHKNYVDKDSFSEISCLVCKTNVCSRCRIQNLKMCVCCGGEYSKSDIETLQLIRDTIGDTSPPEGFDLNIRSNPNSNSSMYLPQPNNFENFNVYQYENEFNYDYVAQPNYQMIECYSHKGQVHIDYFDKDIRCPNKCQVCNNCRISNMHSCVTCERVYGDQEKQTLEVLRLSNF